MNRFSATRVRLAIVGIFVALLALAGLSSVHSQPPGIPRPPGAPGGIGGMPAPPGGFSGLPRPPVLPGGMMGSPGGLPSAPRPPGLLPSSPPQKPKTEIVFKCSRCGAEVGLTTSVCPNCGARLVGIAPERNLPGPGPGGAPLPPPSAGGAPGGIGGAPSGIGRAPGAVGPGADAAPSPIDAGTDVPHLTPPINRLPSFSFPSAPRIPDSGSGPSAAKIAGYILGGALAIGLAVLITRTAVNSSGDKRPRRRRRLRLDDLDDR
jgi:zinc-ribbon domain